MTNIPKQPVKPGDIVQHAIWLLTPRTVWIAGTRNEDGTPNLSTITSVSYTPGPPESMVVSMVARRTTANILRTGEFTMNLANVEMAPLADYVGTVSGEDRVKDAVPYDFAWGDEVKAPVLGASPCVIECKVLQTVSLGESYTFIGDMVLRHVDERVGRPKEMTNEAIMAWLNAVDVREIDPLVYHSYLKYYRVGEKV